MVLGDDQLMRIMQADGVEVERGDMVCLNTGFADVVLEMNRNPDANVLHSTCSGLHGEDP